MFRSTEDMEKVPDLQRFFSCVQKANCRDPAEFWRLKGPFEDLLKSGALADLINQCLQKIAQEPSFNVGSASAIGWTFFAAEATASCTMLSTTRKLADHSLSTLPNNNLVGNVGPHAVRVRLYKVQGAVTETDSHALQHAEDRVVQPGDLIALHAQDHAYTVEALGGSTMLLTLSAPAIYPTTRLFDATTLRPFCSVASNPADSRLEAIAEFLGKFRPRSSLGPLTHLASHPSHFVRWAALRAIGAVSPEHAVPLLHRACQDTHPHIQRAAAATLAGMSPQRSL